MCTIHPRSSFQGDTYPNDWSIWIRAHRVQSGTHHTGATYSPLSDALRGKSGLAARWVLCDSIPTYSKNQCCMTAASNQFGPHDLAAMLTQTPRLRAPFLGSLRKFFRKISFHLQSPRRTSNRCGSIAPWAGFDCYYSARTSHWSTTQPELTHNTFLKKDLRRPCVSWDRWQLCCFATDRVDAPHEIAGTMRFIEPKSLSDILR
jgi:hypothetical protein